MMSMTGFCSLSACIGSRPIPFVGTLKSVNNRYFEVHCKLPSLFQSCEIEIITRLRAALVRGKCSIVLISSNPILLKDPLQPNIQAIHAYLQAIETIQHQTGIEGTLSISDIAHNHEFFSSQEVSLSSEMTNELYVFIDKLISGLIDNRKKEGKILQEDILSRAENIRNIFGSIQQEAHRCFRHKESIIHQQLEQLSVAKEMEVIRYQLSNEAIKSDVTEEIVRFSAHLESLIATTKDDIKEKGKHLDFILQELGREINTIASKSASTIVSPLVITIKVELEKIREQAQNIV